MDRMMKKEPYQNGKKTGTSEKPSEDSAAKSRMRNEGGSQEPDFTSGSRARNASISDMDMDKKPDDSKLPEKFKKEPDSEKTVP